MAGGNKFGKVPSVLSEIKLYCLDIGSRGGVQNFLKRFNPVVEIDECEPDEIACKKAQRESIGTVKFDIMANIQITLFDRSRVVDNIYISIPPFTSKLAWLVDLFDNYSKKLGKDSCGIVLIQCKNADSND